jgi:cell division septation protein DedD
VPASQVVSPAANGAPQPGAWVIQVHALRDRAVANGIVRRLANKGYPAFLVAAGPPTGTFKVQVGRYKDRDEALRIIERLKKEEQFNPWITR